MGRMVGKSKIRTLPAQATPEENYLQRLREFHSGVDSGLHDPLFGYEGQLFRAHAQTKAIRGRGTGTPNQLGAIQYLKSLEAEMQKIRAALDEAWIWIDCPKHFRLCEHHMDRAQQRIHHVIKRLGKRKRGTEGASL